MEGITVSGIYDGPDGSKLYGDGREVDAPLANDVTGRIIAFESGQLSETETISLFQDLVNSGLAWQLQGAYGRTAMNLIQAGLVQPKES